MNENTINNDVTMAGSESVLASRYRIVRQLGQGGMGSVWLAEDMQLDNKLFAIKMLPSILVSNKRAYNQLKSEALVAMKLVHSNIVQIRAFEENNGNPFLVMDYIDGETLDDWLGDRGQKFGCSEKEVVKLLKPIAEALDYAHTEGVVHRDIKPANVMIRKDGRPFIMDFGIAREIQETLTRVTGKMSSGTLMYMSPEQLNGDTPKKEQDIYSFAAMTYECLKSEPPFCRGNIEFQIMNKEPEPLTYGNSSVPANRSAIADSVMSGLAKKPEDRPKTCLAVLGGAYDREENGERLESDGLMEGAESGGGGRDSFSRGHKQNNLEIECLRKRVDAKVNKKTIDGLSGFESEKNELNDILFKAELLLESKLWVDALSEFTVYVNKTSDLLLRHKEIEEAKVETLKPKHGEVKTVLLPGDVPLEMVYVAPGFFDMGSPTKELGRSDDEILHQVNLTQGFWLGKYPITQRQWEFVMGFNPSSFNGLDNPVENVSWNDCQNFIVKCNKELQKEFGGEFRLPTEAEWEYACRAGSKEAYGGTGKLDDMGWYDNNTFFGFGLKTREVGLKSSNDWGFYDMHGNVCEWCQDWYGAYPSGAVTDPTGPDSGSYRVLRGGSWNYYDVYCRSAYRSGYTPGARLNSFGFRLCCSALP